MTPVRIYVRIFFSYSGQVIFPSNPHSGFVECGLRTGDKARKAMALLLLYAGGGCVDGGVARKERSSLRQLRIFKPA